MADGLDGLAVGVEVSLCIRGGARGFAQHVVGIGIAPALLGAGGLEAGVDVLGQHKLASQDFHRPGERGAYHRFAAAGQEATEIIADMRRLRPVQRHYLAGQHQAPGGYIDEQGFAVTEVGAPVAAGQGVFDEGVGGFGVGNPQQGFGQAHQGDAFLAGQFVFLQERIQAAGALGVGANAPHQLPGDSGNPAPLFGVDGQAGQQPPDAFALIGVVIPANRNPQRVIVRKRGRWHQRTPEHGIVP